MNDYTPYPGELFWWQQRHLPESPEAGLPLYDWPEDPQPEPPAPDPFGDDSGNLVVLNFAEGKDHENN